MHRLPHPGGPDADGAAPAPDREGVVSHIHRAAKPQPRRDEDLRGMHLEGQYRPTRPEMPKTAKNPDNIHRGPLFDKAVFHFYLIECSTCHVPDRNSRSLYLVDNGAGRQAWYSTDKAALATRAEDLSLPAAELWKPWINRYERARGDGERYVPAVPKVPQWFGELLPQGSVRPIGNEYVRQAASGQKKLTPVEVVTLAGEKVKQTTGGNRGGHPPHDPGLWPPPRVSGACLCSRPDLRAQER